MRSVAWLACLVVLVGGLAVCGKAQAAAADDQNASRYSEHQEQGQSLAARSDGQSQRCCPHAARFLKCFFGVIAIIHVLLAIWVFTDIRKRGEGNGIFIVLALLAGIPGTILYALVRIGDRKT